MIPRVEGMGLGGGDMRLFQGAPRNGMVPAANGGGFMREI